MRKIFASLPLSKLVSKEISPGIECESAQTLSNYVRDRGSATIFHPVGTCKMGQDNLAVVNSDLKVHGVDGLRVVDASVMPTLIGGNTNAPTIMIAEKAASPGLLRILASADEFVGRLLRARCCGSVQPLDMPFSPSREVRN